MNYASFYRSPFAPRIHFDEASDAAAATAAAAAAAAAASQKPWYEGKVDAEIIGHWDNKGWKKDDAVSIAIEASKAARSLQMHFGVPETQLLKLPKDATDEAGWAAVRQRLGAPKEAKEYDFSGVKRANGGDLDTALADTMRNALHKAGVAKDAAPEAAKAVAKYLDDIEAAKTSERAAALQAGRADLDREWGSNKEFNRLTAMQGAKRAAGSDEGAKKLVEAMESAIGYKDTMEFWRKIGAGTTEDTFVEPGQGGNPVTINGAKARKAELEGDPEWSKRYLAGGHKEKAEMNALLQLIHGAAA